MSRKKHCQKSFKNDGREEKKHLIMKVSRRHSCLLTSNEVVGALIDFLHKIYIQKPAEFSAYLFHNSDMLKTY